MQTQHFEMTSKCYQMNYPQANHVHYSATLNSEVTCLSGGECILLNVLDVVSRWSI